MTANTQHAPSTSGFLLLHFISASRIAQIALINGISSNYYVRTKQSGSGATYSDWRKLITNDDINIIKTGFAYNIPANGKQEVALSVAKSGRTPVAIVGFYGLKDTLYPRQFWIERDIANISIHNSGNTAMTGTIQIFVLYLPS